MSVLVRKGSGLVLGFLRLTLEKLARLFPVRVRKGLTPAYLKFMSIAYSISAFPNPAGRSPFEISSRRAVALAEIRRLIRQEIKVERSRWSLLRHYEESPSEIANLCFKEKGIYPISLSIPRIWHRLPASPKQMSRVISTVFPGEKYSFSVLEDYMHQYSSSALAVTHKKGGWDCFRHLEIMSAGSIPLMPDIQECPRFTMVHYPKNTMSQVVRKLSLGKLPDDSVYKFFSDWTREHLSSAAMVDYIFNTLNLNPKRVLFADEQLPKRADYLSVFTLIGLMQTKAYHVDVAFPVEYIFEDWRGDSGKLYGRGFGFGKVVKSEKPDVYWCSKGTCEGPPNMDDHYEIKSNYDVLVIGDLSANRAFAKRVDSEFLTMEKVYLRGNDLAPTRSEYRWLKSLRGHVFSREIY